MLHKIGLLLGSTRPRSCVARRSARPCVSQLGEWRSVMTKETLRAIGLGLLVFCGAIPLLGGKAFACRFLACYRPDAPIKFVPPYTAGPSADIAACRWKLNGKFHSRLTESGELDPAGVVTHQAALSVHGKFVCAFGLPTDMSQWLSFPVTGTFMTKNDASPPSQLPTPGGQWLHMLTGRVLEPAEMPNLGTLRDIHTLCVSDTAFPPPKKCAPPPYLDCKSYQDTTPGDVAQAFRLTLVGEKKKLCAGGTNPGHPCTSNLDCLGGGTCPNADPICSIMQIDP